MTIEKVDLENGTVEVAEYTQTDAALAMLREKYAVVPDVNTSEGYELVKAGIKELTTFRTTLEAARKRVKDPYLQAGKIIDAEAKRITSELEKLEEPMKVAKKEVDDRIERERQERIARLQVKVDAIKAMPGQVRGKSSKEIADMLDRVGEIDAMHDFYDLTKEAVAARQTALDELAQMLTDRLALEAAEAENKRIEAQNAELRRQQEAQQQEIQRQQDELARQQQEIQRQQEEVRQQREALERAQAALNQPAPAADPVVIDEPVAPVAVAAPVAAAPAEQPAAPARKAKPDNRQWRAVVTDKSALIAAIAAGYGTEDLLIIDQAALDSLANDKRQALELDGVVAEPVSANKAA
jgi:myosin heavy subunit